MMGKNDRRPAEFPRLEHYEPSRFMLSTSYYDAKKADRAVAFIENLRHTKGNGLGNASGCCRGRNKSSVTSSESSGKTASGSSSRRMWRSPRKTVSQNWRRRSLCICCTGITNLPLRCTAVLQTGSRRLSFMTWQSR